MNSSNKLSRYLYRHKKDTNYKKVIDALYELQQWLMFEAVEEDGEPVAVAVMSTVLSEKYGDDAAVCKIAFTNMYRCLRLDSHNNPSSEVDQALCHILELANHVAITHDCPVEKTMLRLLAEIVDC